MAWAAISNIIKPNSINLLKNLYNSKSNSYPKKIECNAKNKAEPIPKNKKYLFFLLSSIFLNNLLYAIQYCVKNIAVIIIPGLNRR